MTAKEYLSQARTIKLRLETMSEQLVFLKSASIYSSPQMSDMLKSPNRNIHKNEDAVIRVIEKEEQIKAVQIRLTEVMATIDAVSDPDQQAELVKRYLGNKTWAGIAAEIYVSGRKVYYIHRDALATVEMILKSRQGSA